MTKAENRNKPAGENARKRKAKQAPARRRNKAQAPEREGPADRFALHLAEFDPRIDGAQPALRMAGRTYAAASRVSTQRNFDILPDLPDIRDRPYRPHLRALEPGIYPRIPFTVRDQGKDNSCTGYALAHMIDLLRMREIGADQPAPVSARMLYEMAKQNDEWDGTAYKGSSLRGAIKGFYRNGVCSEAAAPDTPGGKDWVLSYEIAKEARELRLGAYFRIEPDLTDYHAAINETGCIFVSAQIHSGWDKPQDGKILPGGQGRGGHAFVIAGYDDKGFWVLNSWGPGWGRNGVAHWQYEDWAATVMDAWALQIGVRAPDAFGAAPRTGPARPAGFFGIGEPRRSDILGHFVNIDDGRHVTTDKYGSPNAAEMQETVKRLTDPKANDGEGYEHLMIYAHGGLNKLADDAARIAAWKRNKVFSKHKIYHFHMMWGSGLMDEAFGEMSKSDALSRAGGRFTDWMFETGLGKSLGQRAWRNMKQDTLMAFSGHPGFDGGFAGLKPLLEGLDKAPRRPKIHLAGHSAGSILLGEFLSALDRFQLANLDIASIHLLATACTTAFFRTHFKPYLDGNGHRPLRGKTYLYNLTDAREQADTVSSGVFLLPQYSNSLLYLVSRAFEDQAKTPLAGMELYRPGLPQSNKLEIAYAGRDNSLTNSESHGGFDNDPKTIATVMRRITGNANIPEPPAESLTGY